MSSGMVEQSEFDPLSRKKDPLRLYVRNLNYSTTEETLKENFSKFHSVDVEMKRNGICFISFKTAEDAENARKEMDGIEVDGRKISIDHALEKLTQEEYRKLDSMPKKNLYVTLLDDSVTDEQLETVFTRFGPVESAMTRTNKSGQKFGFVLFVNLEDAKKAQEELNEMDGKPIRVEFASNRRSRRSVGRFRASFRGRGGFSSNVSSKKLYISELDSSTDEKSLQEQLKRFGEIESVEIAREKDSNRPKGFAFVTFSDASAADEALEKLKGLQIDGHEINVEKARGSQRRGRFFRRGRNTRGRFRGRGRSLNRGRQSVNQRSEPDQSTPNVVANESEPVSWDNVDEDNTWGDVNAQDNSAKFDV